MPSYSTVPSTIDNSPEALYAHLGNLNQNFLAAAHGGEWQTALKAQRAYEESISKAAPLVAQLEERAARFAKHGYTAEARAIQEVLPLTRKAILREKYGVEPDFNKNLSLAPAYRAMGYTEDQSEILATAHRDPSNEQAISQAQVIKSVSAIAQKYGVPDAMMGDTVNEFHKAFGAMDVPVSERVKLFETSQRFGVMPGTLIDAERKVRSLVTDQNGTVNSLHHPSYRRSMVA